MENISRRMPDLHIAVEPATLAALRARAKAKGWSLAQIARSAFEQFLKEPEPEPEHPKQKREK